MKNLLFAFALLFLSTNLSIGGYEVDFLIEDAPVSTDRNVMVKQFNLSSAHVNKGSAEIGDEIEPLQTLTIKISDMNNSTDITSRELCDFFNQGEEEKKANQLWQSIIFTVKQEGMSDEDVALYWAPSKSSLFVNGGSKNFMLSAFQRDLPKKDKNGNFKCAVKINFFEKKMD